MHNVITDYQDRILRSRCTTNIFALISEHLCVEETTLIIWRDGDRYNIYAVGLMPLYLQEKSDSRPLQALSQQFCIPLYGN